MCIGNSYPMPTRAIPELLHQARGRSTIIRYCPSRHVITSLLLAVRVCELVLVVQEQYEQVPVLPRHPWVARVANVYS